MLVHELIEQLEKSGDKEAKVVVGKETKNGGIEFLDIDFVTHSDHTGDELDFPAIINVTGELMEGN